MTGGAPLGVYTRKGNGKRAPQIAQESPTAATPFSRRCRSVSSHSRAIQISNGKLAPVAPPGGGASSLSRIIKPFKFYLLNSKLSSKHGSGGASAADAAAGVDDGGSGAEDGASRDAPAAAAKAAAASLDAAVASAAAAAAAVQRASQELTVEVPSIDASLTSRQFELLTDIIGDLTDGPPAKTRTLTQSPPFKPGVDDAAVVAAAADALTDLQQSLRCVQHELVTIFGGDAHQLQDLRDEPLSLFGLPPGSSAQGLVVTGTAITGGGSAGGASGGLDGSSLRVLGHAGGSPSLQQQQQQQHSGGGAAAAAGPFGPEAQLAALMASLAAPRPQAAELREEVLARNTLLLAR